MSDTEDAIPQRLKWGIAFVTFSALFGIFLLRDPPRYGGYSRREAAAILIGAVSWFIILEFGFGVFSRFYEVI